jgi:hypothetical protein
MGLPLEATVAEVATSTSSQTNISPPFRPSRHEYVAPPADKEKELGNTDARVHQPSYGYP